MTGEKKKRTEQKKQNIFSRRGKSSKDSTGETEMTYDLLKHLGQDWMFLNVVDYLGTMER